jgi:hypothetical protein
MNLKSCSDLLQSSASSRQPQLQQQQQQQQHAQQQWQQSLPAAMCNFNKLLEFV